MAGACPGPVRVEAGHRAAEVGDEPLLLARAAPTVVSRDRPSPARASRPRSGAGVIVMDDGLQNPSLAKDLALAVVDGATGLGNRPGASGGPAEGAAARRNGPGSTPCW